MIICKKLDPLDDHSQEARSSRWSFVRGRILRMIICKWPVPPDNHLRVARFSEWSIARGQIICRFFRALATRQAMTRSTTSGFWVWQWDHYFGYRAYAFVPRGAPLKYHNIQVWSCLSSPLQLRSTHFWSKSQTCQDGNASVWGVGKINCTRPTFSMSLLF